jgi:hypothetical protein
MTMCRTLVTVEPMPVHADEGPHQTSRTIDVPPRAAAFLATPSGDQVLRIVEVSYSDDSNPEIADCRVECSR